MFTTPILYSISVIPQKLQTWIKLNPMFGLIEAYRSVIFSRPIEWASLSVSLALTLIILVSGSVYFAKTERSFADII